MASLTAERRRVLEAAQRGQLVCHLHDGGALYGVYIQPRGGGDKEDCTATVEYPWPAGLLDLGDAVGVMQRSIVLTDLGIAATEEG